MKYEEIHELLERYWEGETSLEEERKIKEYFHTGRIDERLRPLAPMFQAFKEEQEVKLASKAKTVTMRPQMYQWATAASIALLLVAGWWMMRDEKQESAIAAAPGIGATQTEAPIAAEQAPNAMVSVEKREAPKPLPRKKSTGNRQKQKPAIDPETARAMEEIKAALALVSSKLDQGRSEAVKGASLLETMEKVPKRKAG